MIAARFRKVARTNEGRTACRSRRVCSDADAVSVGRFAVGFPFEKFLDVPLAVQNSNNAPCLRLNDVEN